MNKPLVPGRYININGKTLRVKSRTLGCKGCALNNMYECPNILVKNKIECTLYNVIFVPSK